jgi:hypothetical protein
MRFTLRRYMCIVRKGKKKAKKRGRQLSPSSPGRGLYWRSASGDTPIRKTYWVVSRFIWIPNRGAGGKIAPLT